MRRVVDPGDGYASHFVTLRGVTLCGRTFDPATEEVEPFDPPKTGDGPHTRLCFDCSSIKNRRAVG